MSERLSLPPIKVSNSYLALQQKRQRGGWWDPKADKTAQIQKVKEMVRHSGHSTNWNPLLNIAPAAEPCREEIVESGRVECDLDGYSSSSSIISDKAQDFIVPVPPKVRKKSFSDTPRLQHIKAGAGQSVGTQTVSKAMPAETQTDSDKASTEKLKESLDQVRKVISKQDLLLKRLERLSSVNGPN